MRTFNAVSILLIVFVIARGSPARILRTFVRPNGIQRCQDCRAIPKVALTREASKNIVLSNLLLSKNLHCKSLEIPALRHVCKLTDNKLVADLHRRTQDADIVVLTSPQAALDFLKAWVQIPQVKKNLKFAVVGKKTGSILLEYGVNVDFIPIRENALSLAQDLPIHYGKNVLFPASTIAQNTIQDELQKRGFSVQRLNIYDTLAVDWSKKLDKLAKEIDIVTLTSPSAAKAWATNAGTNYDVVVIGKTTFDMAVSLGFATVTYVVKESSSLDSLLDGIEYALKRFYGAIKS